MDQLDVGLQPNHTSSRSDDASPCPNNTSSNNGNHPQHPAIAAALQLARSKMNKYCSLTNSTDIYCITMGMSFDIIFSLILTLIGQFSILV